MTCLEEIKIEEF